MRKRWLVTSCAVTCFASMALARDTIAQTLVTFTAPHAVRPPTARLSSALDAKLDRDAATARTETPAALVQFALRETSTLLRFGLGHRTRTSFDVGEREGNCVEYAELFAAIFDRERGHLDGRAWVVRSQARILGRQATDPAWRDHDWVLVVAAGRTLFVDPTLYDEGLGWNIAAMVRGDVRPPGAPSG